MVEGSRSEVEAPMDGDMVRVLQMLSLDIEVQAFSSVDSNGRKSYNKGKHIKWNVEVGALTVEKLMSSVLNEIEFGENQIATLWFYDKRMCEDVRLVDDVQLANLFEMYKTEMHCQIIASVLEKSLCESHAFDWLEAMLEPIRAVPSVDTAGAGTNGNENHNASHPENRGDGVSIAEPDIFDNAEEYVGVNDEHLFTTAPPSQPHTIVDSGENATDHNDDVAVEGPRPPEAEVDDADPDELHVLYDPENPRIEVGALFPDMVTFRKAIRHYAVKIGFEFAKGIRTDKTRYIARCAAKGCPWRIHASRIYDDKTIEIKKLPEPHNCATTKLRQGRMATQDWVADRLTDWLKKNPDKKPKEAKEKVEGDYGINLKYSKAYSGMQLALQLIHGKYEESYQMLFNWKAQMEISSPSSIVEIELKKSGKKMLFKRMFVALKPCIDGFLAGCRPFVGVDATCLNGKYTGQLASATSVDGHNWLFPVAFAIFDSETESNWKWFMHQLRRAIGSPPGLVICTDACKGLENAVGHVFPETEYRECMRHLYGNFIKHFQGDVFKKHLYPAARSYTEGLFKWHMNKIAEFAPEAIKFLDDHHSRIWYRAGFSEESKCDYLTNNVSESFNSQIKPLKGMLLHELVDGLREMIMEKMYLRRKLAREMDGVILPGVMKDLNQTSKYLKVVKVSRSDDTFAEVTLLDEWNNTRRHTVDLENNTCSCRVWQITGKPCKHALAWILSNRGISIEGFVHEYYSVEKFRAAYAARVEAMPDRADWPKVDLGFKVYPPKQKRAPGRPRKQRIRGCLEENRSKRKVRCRRCKGFGHFAKTCKLPEPDTSSDEEPETPKKRKRQEEQDETEDEGGSTSSSPQKQETPNKKKKAAARKKGTPKKKKTPAKKKQKKAASAPPPRVVRSLKDWLGMTV